MEGKNTVSEIKDGNKQGPEGEWLGIEYGTGQRIRFEEPVLVMVLVPVLAMVMWTAYGAEVGSRGSGDGKSEEYVLGR